MNWQTIFSDPILFIYLHYFQSREREYGSTEKTFMQCILRINEFYMKIRCLPLFAIAFCNNAAGNTATAADAGVLGRKSVLLNKFHWCWITYSKHRSKSNVEFYPRMNFACAMTLYYHRVGIWLKSKFN